MALNLHQAWTGGWKRKSQEQRQPASHYALNLYILLAHIYRVPTGDSQDARPQQPACHISFLGTFSFHFKCITFQTFPFWATPCDAKPWVEHIVPAQDTFQPLNSISSLTSVIVCLQLSSLCFKKGCSPVMKYRCGTKALDAVGSLTPSVNIFYTSAPYIKDSYLWGLVLGVAKCPKRAVQHNKHTDRNYWIKSAAAALSVTLYCTSLWCPFFIFSLSPCFCTFFLLTVLTYPWIKEWSDNNLKP